MFAIRNVARGKRVLTDGRCNAPMVRFLNQDNSTPASSEPKTTSAEQKPAVVDSEPSVKLESVWSRLPVSKLNPQDEFQHATHFQETFETTRRIVNIAVNRIFEPSAVALFTFSASSVILLGGVEATLIVSQIPVLESADAGLFAVRYAFAQILPSCVWATQDATLICSSMGFNPETLLRHLDPSVPSDASTLLNIHLLSCSRSIVAGFMLLAQLVRAGAIGVAAVTEYETRIRTGREPPVRTSPLIVRLCGRESDATVTSLQYMKRHLLPIFEEPERIQQLLQNFRVPMYWCVNARKYAYHFSWENFSADEAYFLTTKTGKQVLLLEADATNSGDPLSLEHHALDLTIDDASQGFRRIQERFRALGDVDFRTLRVFLGNSLETFTSGGGHEYTLRHRVRYAKEVDILVDSRAPVLTEILSWCDRVAGEDRTVLFQTNNREYFQSLKLLLERYGYKILDPLDFKLADRLQQEEEPAEKDAASYESLLQILMEDPMEVSASPIHNFESTGEDKKTSKTKPKNNDRKRQIVRLARLPRLVYYGSTAETVNAVEALLHAGAIKVTNCCAILDKDEGIRLLKSVLDKETGLVQQGPLEWRRAQTSNADTSSVNTHGLHIICSSAIYDNLFRQIREWTRTGYSQEAIQKELDVRYEEMLQQSHKVHPSS